jgi:hypothetical protein
MLWVGAKVLGGRMDSSSYLCERSIVSQREGLIPILFQSRETRRTAASAGRGRCRKMGSHTPGSFPRRRRLLLLLMGVEGEEESSSPPSSRGAGLTTFHGFFKLFPDEDMILLESSVRNGYLSGGGRSLLFALLFPSTTISSSSASRRGSSFNGFN